MYGQPATPFLAGVVGRATLLPGVLRHRPHGTEFTTDDGLTLTLPTTDRSEGRARLLVGPEMVAVTADPTEGNRVTVEETVFVGSGRDVTLRTAGGAQILATLYDPLTLSGFRLKFQVQHPRPAGHRMLRWTDEASTSAARNVA